MKSQVHNQGKLLKLEVEIEEDVVKSFKNMSKITGISIDDLVVIALKRYRSSHCDFENNEPSMNV